MRKLPNITLQKNSIFCTFIKKLYICVLVQDKSIISIAKRRRVTVFNTFSSQGFFPAVLSIVSIHPDPCYYFSPSRLKDILNDCEFPKIVLSLYASSNLINSPEITKHGVISVCEI